MNKIETLRALKDVFNKTGNMDKGIEFTDLLYNAIFENKRMATTLNLSEFIKYFNKLDCIVRLTLLSKISEFKRKYQNIVNRQLQFVLNEFQLSIILKVTEMTKKIGIEGKRTFEELRNILSDKKSAELIDILSDLSEVEERLRKYKFVVDNKNYSELFLLEDRRFGTTLILIYRDICSRMQSSKPKRKARRWSEKSTIDLNFQTKK